MEKFSMLLPLCAGNSPVIGEFPTQRPVTRCFDVFFDLYLNKPLSKQLWGWWFETSSRSLWRHCNGRLTASQGSYLEHNDINPFITNTIELLGVSGVERIGYYSHDGTICFNKMSYMVREIISFFKNDNIVLPHGWLFKTPSSSLWRHCNDFTDLRMHLFHMLQCPVQNRNIHFLFWMRHCGIWNRWCILGFVNLINLYHKRSTIGKIIKHFEIFETLLITDPSPHK